MPEYQKGSLGKLVVQDWNVIQSWSDTPELWILNRQQAAALISLAETLKWRTRWENPPDTDTIDAFASETIYNLMNPVVCAALIECLQPALDAFGEMITNNIINQITYGTENPGEPMTGGQAAENLSAGTNPTCDLNVLWAQCLAITQFTNRSIVDVLEKVEVATNVVELAGLVDEIPILELIAKQFGTELATQTINYFQEAVLESYSAQYTEDVENQIACDLFCICSTDCLISVDRVWSVFEQRLSSLIPTSPGDFIDLIEIMAGIDFDGTEVVDICFYFAWGAAKLAQFLFGEPVATTTFNLVTQLAVNDANNDWTLLCDCPEIWTHVLNSDDLTGPLVIPDTTVGSITDEVISTTTGVTFGQDISGMQVAVVFPTLQQIVNVTIEATDFANVPGDGLVNHFAALRDSGSGNITGVELPDQNGDWTREITGTWDNVAFFVLQYVYLGLLVTGDMKITITGRGTNPFV